MPTYQPNIPSGTVPLDQDYLNLKGNFQQLNIAYGVDHIPFSDTTGVPPAGDSGKHMLIHMLPISKIVGPNPNYPPTPPLNVGCGEWYTTQSNDGNSADEMLWYQSGGGRVTQFSSNFQPKIGSNGATYLPGGLMMIWATVNSTSSGTVTISAPASFGPPNPIIFPHNCFSVFTQPFTTGAIVPGGTATVDVRITTKSTFQWAFITSSSNYSGFFWMALGN